MTPQILEFVFQISEKVISTQVKINPEIITTIVRETLEVLIESQEVYIHIHPEDLSSIERYIHRQIEDGGRIPGVILVPDDTVEKGGCIAETKTKFIDNQISSRLNLIVEKTLNFVRENNGDA
jgi:flagellar assembly protein FliH